MYSSKHLAGLVGLTGLLVVLMPGPGAGVSEGQPEFSGERAMQWIERQCAIGPRTPGSSGIQQLRQQIAALADSLGLNHFELCFSATNPAGGGPVELCNLVISAGPSGGSRLWLGAHYDTRPFCDQDPDPEQRQQPLVGANDGASGTAVLLHLAELMSSQPPARGVDLIFFDGEDSGAAGDISGFCLGSRQLAATWRDFSCPLAAGQPEGLILLDMVGKKDLLIRQERYSSVHAGHWTRLVFERAAELGLSAFMARPGQGVYDDHVPFLEVGIPAVDLIDFEFPEWHTTADTPDICSPESLEQVGKLVTDIVYRPLAGVSGSQH